MDPGEGPDAAVARELKEEIGASPNSLVLVGMVYADTGIMNWPTHVYGYAALVGYTFSAGKLDALTAGDNSNPLFLIVVSAILGAVLGYLMGQLAAALKTKAARAS